MRKLYVLLFTLFVGMACSLSACGNPYKNMKMELLTDASIEIQLTENTEVETPEGELDPNTAEVSVKISGVSEKVSKLALFTSSDPSKLRVKSTELQDDVTTAELVAYKPGNVELYINSEEGGQKQTVKVSIVRKVSAVAFEESYKPAVIAGGAPITIDTTKLLFTPSDANVRDCEFSLVDGIDGIIIDENGVLMATNASMGSVRVRATPKFAESAEIFAEVEVKILPHVDAEALSFSGAFADGGSALQDTMMWVKNDPTKSLYTVSFNYGDASVKDMLRIRAVIKDETIMTEKISARTDTSVTLSAIDTGVVNVDFEIYYDGYENVVVTRSAQFNIIDAVTTIKANDGVDEITIFNTSRTSASRGTELIITLKPNTSSNLKFKLEIAQERKDHLKIVDALGGDIGNENGEIESGTKMYFSHDGTMSNDEFTFQIVPVGEALCEPFVIKVNCLTGVENVVVADSFMLWYSETNGYGVDRELDYAVQPEGARKSTVQVISNNEEVIQVYFDEDNSTHRIKALKTGFATLSFVVNGRTYGNTSIEVVAPFESFFTRINSPKEDSSVIDRTMVDVTSGEVKIGQTVESAVIEVGNRIKINADCYPSSAKAKSVEYRIESVDGINSGRASITDDGYLVAESVIDKFKVIVSVVGYTYDSTSGQLIPTEKIEREILFTSIIPVESLGLNKNNITLMDFNSLGISEIEKSQQRLVANIYPTNATKNKLDVVWSVKETQYRDIVEVRTDGSAFITGQLAMGDGNSRTVTIVATITEYSRTFSVECLVTIKKAKTVGSILLDEYDEERGVYLKSTNSTSGDKDSYQIKATAVPADADNTTFVYRAFDITPLSGAENVSGWFTNETYYARADESQLIDVSDTGLITPKSGTGGYAIIWIIPADNIKTTPIIYSQITMKRVLLVRVADGSIEAPYEIRSYTDLLEISNALDKSYVLSQSIDLSGINNFAPIGTVENPFTGTLSGKYITNSGKVITNTISNFRLNINGEGNGYYGLFTALGASDGTENTAKISDLTITLIASNFTANLAQDGSAYLGVVAGINYGTIENVKVRFNGNLSVTAHKNGASSENAVVGGIVGVNYGVIRNSASITYNVLGIMVTDGTTANTRIGGVCGENRKQVLGQFEFVGDLLTPSDSEISYNIEYNDATVNSSIYLVSTKENTILGGVCAVNYSEIDGAYSTAMLFAPKNVGGIAGINYSKLTDVRFTGFIKSNELVGGIAGTNNNGVITFAIVEICDDRIHFTSFNSGVKVENYGGVVGLNGGAIRYSFINSYSAQRTDNNEYVDMRVIGTTISNFGAFVGKNAMTIEKCFANVQLDENNANIFVGAGTGTITSCYSLAYVGDYTTTKQTMYGESASDFTTKTGMNFGEKIIKITNYAERGDVLLTESPESVQVSVYGGLKNANTGRDGAQNKYYKYSDKQMVLFYNVSSENTETNNTYELKNIFNVTVTPNTNRNKNIIVTVVEGQNIVKVEGDSLITKGQGRAVLRFACDLDQSVYDEIEIYVVYGITGLNVANIATKEKNNQQYNELKMQLDSSFDFDIINSNSIANKNYFALASGGYLFEFEEKDLVKFDISIPNTEKSTFVGYENSQIMTALGVINETSARIYPYVSAQFSNGEEVIETKVVLWDIYYSYNLTIYQGLSDINLQSASEEIMPDTTLNYKVDLTTDLSETQIDLIRIYNGEKTETKFNENDYEEFDLSSGLLNKQVTANTKFAMNILSTTFDDDSNTKSFVFEIAPSTFIDGEEAILSTEIYTIEFVVTLANGTKVTKTFKLTIKPQSLSSILANHYNDGADFDVNLTGAGEEVSTKIISGQYGLLVVNVWPEYSVFDRLEVTSSTVQEDTITFEQVYYNVDDNNYDTKVENTQIIQNGISVKRQSTKKLNNGEYEYSFDGRIFLRTLTGSAVTTGQVFTITISAYAENETTPYIVKTIELTALQAPYLTFDLTTGRSYKNIAHEYYVAYNVANEFTMVTDTGVNVNSGISSKITDENGNAIAGVSLVKNGEAVFANSKQTIHYIIVANTKFEIGKTYNVEVVVQKTTNGVKTKTKLVAKLHIVDFLITGFDVVDGETDEIMVSNGTLSRPLSTLGWQVDIKLKTVCNSTNVARVLAIEDLLNGKQKLTSGKYYNPWKYKVLSGTGVGQFETIDSADVSPNFALTTDGTGYRLLGKTIANVDTLMVDFSYYYNDKGYLTLQSDAKDSIDGNPSTQFRLDFSLSTSEDHPLPITTKEEFLEMEEGVDYILLSDIDLGYSYVPLNTKIHSLDGNGYTITIQSFSTVADDKSSTSINLGLFGSVDSDTTLKNVTVTLKAMTYDLQDYETVNFGGIAGENAGTITNSFVNQKADEMSLLEQTVLVQSSSESSTIVANIAGFVGTNTGTITNSRVEYLTLSTSGNVGGFVAQNSATISSSYVLEPIIESTSGITGGFVASNSGEINTSYVRGRYVADSLRADVGSLNSVGQVGGFVCDNYGDINDCYANIKITSQFRSAGFVYNNGRNAEIYNCLSLSDIIQNSIAHMPFVGTDSSDRYLNEGTLQNAYYYRYSDNSGNADRFVDYDIDGNKNPAQVMTANDLKSTTSLAGFAFSDSNAEFSGVWVQPTNSTSAYFNASTNLETSGLNKLAFKVGVPELVAPNVIARSVRRIDSIDADNTTGESIYNYVYVTQSNYDATTNEKYGYDIGTIHNQALIGSAEDFVSIYEKEEQNGELVTSSKMNSRLIRDVDFSSYEQSLRTPKVTISGIIEGNGLSMQNISVVSNVDEKAEKFGLFKNIIGDSASLTNNIASIKNIDFSFIEVKSSSSNIVGSVAGAMTNANLIDVYVSGNQVAVKGANIVGGVVGLVDGNSKLYHVSTNISVNSGYRNSGNEYFEAESESINTRNVLYANDSMFYSSDVADGKIIKNTTEYVSYAGAVAGVVDTKTNETMMECYQSPNIYDINVEGGVKVIGATAGGVFGMVGLYTYISNVYFEIGSSSYISGDDFAGGIVGELRGKMAQAKIAHVNQSNIDKLSFGATSDDINLTLFKKNTTTKASGGLVGFNFGGTILDSISHAYVRNEYSNIAGGAVGVTISGDIKAVVASGSVLGRTSVGGLIGGIISTYETGASYYNKKLLPLYYDRELNIDCTLNFDPVIEDDKIIQKDQNSMGLSYVMAGNNWTTDDQASLELIQNWGGLIGIFDDNLSKTYINTTHPKDKNSRVNLINFYVAGGNDTDMLLTRGNEDDSDEWMHIAEPIPFSSLTEENRELYFGNYYRFVWDLTGEDKYPEMNIKAIPETITIESASDLLQIIWNLSGNYLIVDDIDLSGIDSWLPLGSETEPFTGTLRSDVKVKEGTYATKNTYYQIQNLKIVASNLQNVGLFGVTGYNYETKSGATFENLVITVDEIVGKDFGSTSARVGALVADARGATIKNVVTTKATKNSMIVSSSEYTGGIVGVLENLLVEDDEDVEENGNIVITSTMEDCLSSLDIGILKRETSVVGGKVAKVGGVIGQIDAGTVERLASNQKIGLVEQTRDESDGSTIYTMLDSTQTYTGEYYNMTLYVGGVIGANGSQTLQTDQGSELQTIEIKQSFSDSDIEILALNLYSENQIDTIIGGFIGRVDQNASIANSYTTGEITVAGKATGETVRNDIVISGFAGQIVVPQTTSGETVISKCYSLTTLVDNSNEATIKGFAQIMGYSNADLFDITNNSNARLIASDCVYEHYYALVVDYDSYFGTSSGGLRETFDGEASFKQDPTLYYPVLGVNSYTLGINDRTQDFAVYGSQKGTKVNPIIIDEPDALLNIADLATGSDEYNYYLVTTNVEEMPTHITDNDGNIVSNNSPMIKEFYGFLNGNGLSVNGFTIKESPKEFDEDFNEIEDTSGVENVGFFRTLKAGSCISGLSFSNVYIDFQSSSEITNSELNVAGLVGKMESGSKIFASTVSGEIFVKGAQTYENIAEVKTLVSRKQTLNVGGLAGNMDGGSIINSANYARIASFDYKVYKKVGSTGTASLSTLNAGGLAGKIDNNASLLNVFSISQFNYNDNNSEINNIGQIAGYAKDSTIKNYYGKVEIVKQEYTNSEKLDKNVGNNVTSAEGRTTNIISNELVQNIGNASADELRLNYGYEFNPLLTDNVPVTSVKESVNGETKEFFIPANTETMMNLMKGDYNIKLQSDIYIDSSAQFMKGTTTESVPSNNMTVSSYSGTINGDYNRVYGVKGVLALNLTGTISNIGFSGTDDYNITSGGSGNIVKVMGSTSKVSVVDLCITDNELGLATTLNSGYTREDLNVSNSLKLKLNSELWMNMSASNDASEDNLRAFVEYWSETDVRGVYLETNEAVKTVKIKDENGNETVSTDTEWRNSIKDTYQLAKYAKLVNDGDVFELKVTELDYTANFDLGGKIWSSLTNESNSILSSSEALDEKATIKNMYVEGLRNLGFISNFNSPDGKISNLKFENAKIVNVGITDSTKQENIGVVVGNFVNGTAENISVTGVVNIDVPTANYVGVAFGRMAGALTNIDVSTTSENVAKSKVQGLDFVGAISGSLTLSSKVASYVDNNYNIQGRDFVGGLFGYTTGSNNPNVYFYEKVTKDGVTSEIYHKNSGNVQGRNFVGGIIGYNGETTLNLPTNEGNVEAVGYAVGGIAGYSSARIFSALNGVDMNGNKTIQFNNLIETSSLEQTTLAETLSNNFEGIALEDATYSVNTLDNGYFYGGIVGYLDGTDIRADIANGDSSSRANKNYAQVESNSFVGGIVGYNRAGNLYAKNVYLESVDNSVLGLRNYASVIGKTFVGGIAGININSGEKLATIKDSVVDISTIGRVISGEYCVGGVVGANYGQVWSVASAGSLSGQTTNLGGIVGYNGNTGDIQYANSSMILTISANDNTMTTTSGLTISGVDTSYYVGGVVGYNQGSLKKSTYNKGGNTSSDAGTIKFAINSSLTEVATPTIYVGGVVGANGGNVEQVYMDVSTTMIYSTYEGVTISGNIHFGGLVGLNKVSATIKDSYSLAKIINRYNLKLQGGYQDSEIASVDSVNAGGLVYENLGNISSCYATYCIYAKDSGTVSDDCYVMTLSETTKTTEGGSTTTLLNYVVDETSSQNVDAFYKFIDNKFILSEVEIAKININTLRSEITYPAQTLSIKFESKDGTFADTEFLVNKNSINVEESSGYFGDSAFECECDSNCNCSSIDCCNEHCACRLGGIGTHASNCVYKHKKLWLEYFSTDETGKAPEFINKLKRQILKDVVFNLAFTGVKTPSNRDVESNAETVSPTIENMPTTGFIGDGSMSNPYRIYSVDDLDTLNRQLEFGNNFVGKTFKLMRDINLNGARLSISSADYTFQGVFDGNGKTIYGNTINDGANDNVGLFQVLGSGGQIKDLNLVNCVSSGKDNVALLVGKNQGTIKNINIYAGGTSHSKVSGGENVGAVVGYNLGSIENCSISAEVVGTKNVGIIAGANSNGRVYACETLTTHTLSGSASVDRHSSAEGTENVGGIVGYNAGVGTISQCSNEAAVTCSSGYGGGIVGLSDAKVISQSYYVISDVINRGVLIGDGKLGQLGGKIADTACNIMGTSNVKALGESTASIKNCYVVDNSNTELYQNNAFKSEVYSGFDFDTVWGMSYTQLNVETNQYSYPLVDNGSYNYPKLRKLNSSKELDAQKGGYFVNQYFNVDDYKSTNPTVYVESQYQFNLFINYFLGELIAQDTFNPQYTKDPNNEGSYINKPRHNATLWQSIKNNLQYKYASASYKLYKGALTDMSASNRPTAYQDTQTFSDWVALPEINNLNIDFSGITIKINSFTNKYLINNNSGWSIASFISIYDSYNTEFSLSGNSGYTISNLNISFNSASGGLYFGGIVGQLQNGILENCSVTYTGSATIAYGGTLTTSSRAGIFAGVIKQSTDEDSTYAIIKNCTSTGITADTFVNYSEVNLEGNVNT